MAQDFDVKAALAAITAQVSALGKAVEAQGAGQATVEEPVLTDARDADIVAVENFDEAEEVSDTGLVLNAIVSRLEKIEGILTRHLGEVL
jgi:hypothetical protein